MKKDTFKRVKILQRGKAHAMKQDNGEWIVSIQVWVGQRQFTGAIVVPFGLHYEMECQEIAEEFNRDG
jgi:hypothetical protein